jgi:hypothetical protein
MDIVLALQAGHLSIEDRTMFVPDPGALAEIVDLIEQFTIWTPFAPEVAEIEVYMVSGSDYWVASVDFKDAAGQYDEREAYETIDALEGYPNPMGAVRALVAELEDRVERAAQLWGAD